MNFSGTGTSVQRYQAQPRIDLLPTYSLFTQTHTSLQDWIQQSRAQYDRFILKSFIQIHSFSIKMEDVYLNEKRTCCKPDSNLGNLHKHYHKSNHSNMLIWETFHIISNVMHTFLSFQTSGFPHFVCNAQQLWKWG